MLKCSAKKRLVIIMGVTGAIGSALMERFGAKRNTVIYGISRRALSWQDFICPVTGKLYLASLICSLEHSEASCTKFIEAIDFEQFSQVIYIHCVGAYLFEINSKGEFLVENDQDADGINDLCTLLSCDLFRWMAELLIKNTHGQLNCVTLGGLADEHEPRIIQSWWRSLEKTKKYMQEVANDRIGMLKVNISSVFCPHELIMRPFVFTHTDADQTAWLAPTRLARQIDRALRKNQNGYHELDVFNNWDGFFSGFHTDQYMVPRRLAEIGAGN